MWFVPPQLLFVAFRLGYSNILTKINLIFMYNFKGTSTCINED